MKKSRSVLLAILVTFILVASPLTYLWQTESLENRDLSYENNRLSSEIAVAEEARLAAEGEMLFYDLNGLNVTAESKEVAFSDVFTTDELNARAADCAKTVDPSYYTTLANAFAEVKGLQYSFSSNTDEGEVYTVTVFPNAPEYKDLGEFQADFELCSAGGTAAVRMNQEKLMFNGSCSAAYTDENMPTLACSDIEEDLVLEFN